VGQKAPVATIGTLYCMIKMELPLRLRKTGQKATEWFA
jgi:hypothetical protein